MLIYLTLGPGAASLFSSLSSPFKPTVLSGKQTIKGSSAIDCMLRMDAISEFTPMWKSALNLKNRQQRAGLLIVKRKPFV